MEPLQHPEVLEPVLLEDSISNGSGDHVDEPAEVERIQEAVSDRGGLEPVPEGWLTANGLARGLRISVITVRDKISPLLEERPEWVATYIDNRGRRNHPSTFLHPELVDIITQEIEAREVAPDGWMTNTALQTELGRSASTVAKAAESYREEHPDWFQEYVNPKSRQTLTYYAPELIDTLKQELEVGDVASEGWLSTQDLSKQTGRDQSTIKRIANRYLEEHPEWEKDFRSQNPRARNKPAKHYSPELVEAILAELPPLPPEGWLAIGGLAKVLGKDWGTVKKYAEEHREEHPDWFGEFAGKARSTTEYISPELEAILTEKLVGTEQASEGWVSRSRLAKELGRPKQTVGAIAEKCRDEHPEWFQSLSGRGRAKGKVIEHYSPELVELITNEFEQRVEAPEGWMTIPEVAKQLGRGYGVIHEGANSFRDEHPEWFSKYVLTTGHVVEHLSPELVEQLMDIVEMRDQTRSAPTKERLEELELQESVESFLGTVNNGESEEGRNFQKLIQLFGPERALDILYRYREEYRKLDVPFVRRIIGEYLGDFLTLRPGLQLEDLEEGVSYLGDPSLKAGLIEVMKNDALRYYNERHRTNPEQSALDIFALYIDNLRTNTSGFITAELAEAIDEVSKYYSALFEVIRPENMVDQLKDGRLFPDVNQRINIKEIELKHKMLIADEMGVGKSASAILAKETLRVKQALIVVPSNVVDVWRKYLSDQRAANGETEGYFKEGQAPSVLIIESLKQLREVNPEDYDYVILSQERLNSKYVEALRAFDYGMLIVDEIHKLKNIGQGKRAENLIELAARIEEGDETKYLALLSGTPVPNKVGDVAMILRLLYPEKFEHINNQELTRQILKGDMLDLRSLLVPRMQMKSLAESIEIPNLHEETHLIDMTEDEASVYEILLEEDELTASQKIQILRQFLLNPAISEVTPGIMSAKLEAVRNQLQSTYMNNDKVVMFVNGYVEGVIRGEPTIFDQLDLPEDVELHVIDGKVSKEKRLEIQQLLRDPGRKMLLAVSGQTADVGVDFSGAQEIVFYNEPWTRYDKRQQLGRVWRPGLKDDLVSHTFYARGTIEEGIHRYTEVKERAIEKLLRGVPLSELEREMLKADEQESSPDLDVNPTLAEHYFSAWDRLLKIFNYVKEIGETNFVEFKNRYGEEYARCYTEMGSRSYQSNVNRLAGTVIDRVAKAENKDPEYVRILDVASGPEMLKKHIPDEYQDGVISVDINPHHFEQVDDKRRVGSFLDLPVADSTVDYANLALALHYTKFLPSRQNYERLEVFKELNRVLVTGGVAVVSLMHTLELKHPNTFKKAIEKMGFKTIEKYTGTAEAGQGFRTRVIVLKKVHDCPQNTSSLVRTLGSGMLFGFKFAKNKVDLRDSRKIVTKFSINGKRPIEARLNSTDKQVFSEEQAILALAKELKRRYRGEIQRIPRDKIELSGFARAWTGRKYVLFKRLESSTGAVIAR